VPLMVVGPNVPADKKITTPVYLQDIMPTTLELAGVEKPAHVEFKSLSPLLAGKETEPYDAIYGAYLGLQRMVTQDNHKLILYPKIKKVLLYDLKEDPLETKNLAYDPAQRPRLAKLMAKFLELQQGTGDKLDIGQAFPELVKAARARR